MKSWSGAFRAAPRAGIALSGLRTADRNPEETGTTGSTVDGYSGARVARLPVLLTHKRDGLSCTCS